MRCNASLAAGGQNWRARSSKSRIFSVSTGFRSSAADFNNQTAVLYASSANDASVSLQPVSESAPSASWNSSPASSKSRESSNSSSSRETNSSSSPSSSSSCSSKARVWAIVFNNFSLASVIERGQHDSAYTNLRNASFKSPRFNARTPALNSSSASTASSSSSRSSSSSSTSESPEAAAALASPSSSTSRARRPHSSSPGFAAP
mmetsp:Transcript_1787/g.7038  ORF Transcript_1787/g.7038 Transcript_1787/m.7038 type:complete len:205 (-) Transcript_1787:191-805(-)